MTNFPTLRRSRLEVLQVNLGYRCNQQCVHCHVNAGPDRKEMMEKPVVDQVIHFLIQTGLKKLDLTGGAPELNPHFRYLVHTAREMGIHIIDRCNLTILKEPGQERLAEFLAEHHVEIIASLPCYLRENVDRQRGTGVFDRSICALKKLNRIGYGHEGSTLILNLVHNPLGHFLPPPQERLEQEYRKQLGEHYGIVFNHLYTLINMPIQRFGKRLISEGQFESYINLLQESHRDANLGSVMCRSLISVDWQGYVYDCDFNQMLKIPMCFGGKSYVPLSELTGVKLEENPIRVRDHCYGCTAGQGSSCTGTFS